MIFVILGSQKFQFNRLLEYMDNLIEKGLIKQQVICQSGYSDYTPKNFEKTPFLDKSDFLKYISQSDLVITHGGTGAIVNSLNKMKKVIAVPRDVLYGEHVDNHQYEIIETFARGGYILSAESYTELEIRVEEIDGFIPQKFISNNDSFLNDLEKIIDEIL